MAGVPATKKIREVSGSAAVANSGDFSARHVKVCFNTRSNRTTKECSGWGEMSSIGSGAVQSWQLLLTNAIKTGEEARVRDVLRDGVTEHFGDKKDVAVHLAKALLQAVGSKYAESLTRILLEEGADANSVSETGKSLDVAWTAFGFLAPVHWKCGWLRTDLFEGVPALHRAAWLGKDAVVRLLLDYNAKTDIRNWKDGHTAIFEAVSKYRASTFKLLMAAGADINAKDK